MKLRDFVVKHREALTVFIQTELRQPYLKVTDNEREQWVRNHKTLYNWARAEGVKRP